MANVCRNYTDFQTIQQRLRPQLILFAYRLFFYTCGHPGRDGKNSVFATLILWRKISSSNAWWITGSFPRKFSDVCQGSQVSFRRWPVLLSLEIVTHSSRNFRVWDSVKRWNQNSNTQWPLRCGQIKGPRGGVIQGSEKQVFILWEKSESRRLFASGRVTHCEICIGHWADDDWIMR